jgi:hypothetical protein
LPEEPYATRYEIIVRYSKFLDEKPYGAPEYEILRARYEGNGKWREQEEFDPFLDPRIDEFSESILVSSGMKVILHVSSDCFENEGEENMKLGIDVAAYSPLSEIPDLSDLNKLRPMKVE